MIGNNIDFKDLTLSKKEYILNAYEYAKMNNFRFFSFGDAMFIKKDVK